MSDLPACAVLSHEHLPVNDHASADSCAQSHHDHIFFSRAAAFPHLTECSDIGVISDLSLKSGKLFQLPLDLLIFPSEIRTSIDNSVRCHRRGDADSDSHDIFFGKLVLLGLFRYGSSNIRKDRLSFL